MKRVAQIAILAFISITILSGCLVEKKDVEQVTRTAEELHIYKANEFITYSVNELRFSDFSTRVGTLTIQWLAHAPLRRPGTTTDITVLEEVIKLSFDSGADETGTVRYISQDATGKVTLHAIQAPGINQYYWLSTNDISTLTTPTESFTIVNSPMSVGLNPPTVSFYAMEDCDPTSGVCPRPLGLYSDNMNIVGDTTSITTGLGIFTNPFQISFNGTTIPTNGSPIVDVRNICGTISTTTTHTGTMYVIPEIGIIQMTNTCNDTGGDKITHTITITDTNI